MTKDQSKIAYSEALKKGKARGNLVIVNSGREVKQIDKNRFKVGDKITHGLGQTLRAIKQA